MAASPDYVARSGDSFLERLSQPGLCQQRHDLIVPVRELRIIVDERDQSAVHARAGQFDELIRHLFRGSDQGITAPSRDEVLAELIEILFCGRLTLNPENVADVVCR